MEKEEKKADLKQLLNSLIDKGRVPFGEKEIKNIKILGIKDKRWNIVCQIPGGISKHCTYKELASKESGLWQFVCENKLITNSIKMREAREHDIDDYSNILIMYDPYECEFRLIESALKDESELEDFLLSNIKVEGIS